MDSKDSSSKRKSCNNPKYLNQEETWERITQSPQIFTHAGRRRRYPLCLLSHAPLHCNQTKHRIGYTWRTRCPSIVFCCFVSGETGGRAEKQMEGLVTAWNHHHFFRDSDGYF